MQHWSLSDFRRDSPSFWLVAVFTSIVLHAIALWMLRDSFIVASQPRSTSTSQSHISFKLVERKPNTPSSSSDSPSTNSSPATRKETPQPATSPKPSPDSEANNTSVATKSEIPAANPSPTPSPATDNPENLATKPSPTPSPATDNPENENLATKPSPTPSPATDNPENLATNPSPTPSPATDNPENENLATKPSPTTTTKPATNPQPEILSSPTGENGYPRENREIASSPSVSEEKSPNIDNSRSNRSTEPGTNTTENATVGEIGVTANILASRLADPNRDIPDRPAKPNPTHGNAVFYLSEGETDFGRVMVITVLVEADGSSHVIAVHSQQGETISSNHPYQRIARSLVEKWQFQPAQTAGQPVASLLDVEVKLVSR